MFEVVVAGAAVVAAGVWFKLPKRFEVVDAGAALLLKRLETVAAGAAEIDCPCVVAFGGLPDCKEPWAGNRDELGAVEAGAPGTENSPVACCAG